MKKNLCYKDQAFNVINNERQNRYSGSSVPECNFVNKKEINHLIAMSNL